MLKSFKYHNVISGRVGWGDLLACFHFSITTFFIVIAVLVKLLLWNYSHVTKTSLGTYLSEKNYFNHFLIFSFFLFYCFFNFHFNFIFICFFWFFLLKREFVIKSHIKTHQERAHQERAILPCYLVFDRAVLFWKWPFLKVPTSKFQ